jgi:hypothetical protein
MNEIPESILCYGNNNLYEEMLAIHFTSKKKVKFSYVRFGKDSSEKYIMVLNKDASLKYEVNEKYIVIKKYNLKNIFNFITIKKWRKDTKKSQEILMSHLLKAQTTFQKTQRWINLKLVL